MSLYSLIQFLWERPESAQVERLLVAPLLGRLQALPENSKLGWKGLPGGKHSSLFSKFVSNREILITLAPSVSIIKLMQDCLTQTWSNVETANKSETRSLRPSTACPIFNELVA
jgi:hypothetical protein